MKLYGSLSNRFEENRMYCDGIKVGTGVTKYCYSDRHAYEVVKVIDQTHVFIREYDHKPAGEPMSNQWELISNENNPVIELKLRNGVWHRVLEYTKEKWMRMAQKWVEDGSSKTVEAAYNYFKCMSDLTEKQNEKIEQGKAVKKYNKFGNISFGVAEYYYDYEF
jgi:hypothetical protein